MTFVLSTKFIIADNMISISIGVSLNSQLIQLIWDVYLRLADLCGLFGKLIYTSNSNWTEWSAIQELIGRVISKSDEREAHGRFEITSTITPWIGRYEVPITN